MHGVHVLPALVHQRDEPVELHPAQDPDDAVVIEPLRLARAQPVQLGSDEDRPRGSALDGLVDVMVAGVALPVTTAMKRKYEAPVLLAW